MDAQQLSFRTELGDAGLRLDQVCAGRLATLSRTRIKTLVQEGRVLVDGRPSTPSFRVNPDQTVTVAVPAPLADTVEPWSTNLSIVFEDEHLAVIDKPPGLSMHPGPGHPNRTLVNALVHRWPDWHTPGSRQPPGLGPTVSTWTRRAWWWSRAPRPSKPGSSDSSANAPWANPTRPCWTGGWNPPSGTVNVPLGRHPRWHQRQAAFPAGSAVAGIRVRNALTDYKISRYLVSRPPGRQHPFSLTGPAPAHGPDPSNQGPHGVAGFPGGRGSGVRTGETETAHGQAVSPCIRTFL